MTERDSHSAGPHRPLPHNVGATGLSGNVQGALWMLASGAAFTVFAVLVKVMSADYSPAFLAFWRAFIALVLSVPFIMIGGWSVVRVTRPGLVFVRSIFGTFGFLLSIYAISDAYGLPLSQFNAISFSRSLFVTVLAALILRESVGKQRWGAVIVGFGGVIVMVLGDALMSGEGLSGGSMIGTLLALGSSVSLAGAIIMVKSLAATHKPITLLIWANILSTVFLAPFAVLHWSAPSLQDWGVITALSACAFGGQFCYIKAMSVGDASFLSPMDYLRLPMAAGADWLLFRILPGLYVWIGAALIVGSTLFIAVREARKRGVPAGR
ncbi:MAG: DMT family transporter [Pseudomonadota bacterium]